MSTMSAPDLSGDRLLVITNDDRRGTIMVVAIICCVYCPMVIALRAVGSLKNLGTNDFLAIVATLTGFVEYILVIVAASYGLGRTFDEVDEHHAAVIGKLVVASEVMFFLTLTLAKCSVAMLCRRLFAINMKKKLLVCDIAGGVCAAWGVGAIITITADCGPAQQIGYNIPFCSGLSDRWTGVAVTDAITEILLFMLAIFVVVPLQVRLKRKAEVLASFVPRLLMIVLIGLNAQSIHRQVVSDSPGVSLTGGTVYRQTQLITAIVTAALPALNRGLRLFHGTLGNAWLKTSYSLSHSAGNTTGKEGSNGDRVRSNIKLKSLDRSINRSTAMSPEPHRITEDADAICLRPDSLGYHATASGHPSGTDAESSKSVESTGSKSRIIRMERHWQVHHEDVA